MRSTLKITLAHARSRTDFAMRRRGNMKRILRRLLHTEEGQDLIEYGLLAAFISIAALAAVKAIGPLVVVLYEAVVTAMTP